MSDLHQNRSKHIFLTLCLLFYLLFGNLPYVLAEPDFCLIPAGTFTMGSDSDLPNEAPAHEIYLDAYHIGKTEVTNAEYYQFWLEHGGTDSEHTPISYGGEFGIWPDVAKTKPNHPVIGVSWHSAAAYAAWRGMRLPTEAEWEKAARGTKARRWPWGNTFKQRIKGTTTHANVRNSSDGNLQPVVSYPTGASPYGAHDMAGNVWEWVDDWYSETYYHHSLDRNPKGPTVGSRRVVRGGSWLNAEMLARCSTRIGQYPEIGTSFIGFRLAKDATPLYEK
jgi:formylglycine-generating enzyme required for sulfatase activity